MTSHYWRADLKKRAEKLRSKEEQKKWGEDSLCILEQVVVLGFYSIRRLELSGLCPPEKLRKKHQLTEYKCIHNNPNLAHSAKEECYDFANFNTIQKEVSFIEHQLSQSCFFESQFNQQHQPESCFFTSDHQKSKALYKIKLQDIIEIFESVSELDIM
jgi:hypothetical protein